MKIRSSTKFHCAKKKAKIQQTGKPKLILQKTNIVEAFHFYHSSLNSTWHYMQVLFVFAICVVIADGLSFIVHIQYSKRDIIIA